MFKNPIYKKIIISVAIIGLLVAMGLLLLKNARDDSATTDEPIHILAGYEYWRGEFRVNPEHPPLGKQINAVFLNWVKPVMPEDQKFTRAISDYYYDSWYETRVYAQNWLYSTAGNNADNIVFYARLPIILFTLVLGIILFLVGKRFYGLLAGLVALFFFALSPDFLTHGHLANTDLWMTLGFFIFVFSFGYYLEKPNWKRLVLAALCFAFAMLVKFSAVLLVPILIILWLVKCYMSHERKKYGWKNFAIIFITLLVTTLLLSWALYGFPLHAAPKFINNPELEYTNTTLVKLAPVLTHLPLPEYFKGLIMVFASSVSSRPAYLFGHFSSGGWWYYFPVAFMVKTPLSVIILLFAAVGFNIGWRKKLEFRDWLLIIPPAFYLLVSMFSRLNIGIRHILPIYPFIYLYIGYFVVEFFNRHKNVSRNLLITYYLLLTALLAWYLYAAISVYPYFMTYFNELVGGPKNGSNVLLDSNIDWGQNTKRIADYLRAHNIDEKIKLEYFWSGTVQPNYYKINYENLRANDPSQKGWIIIATFALETDEFSWLKNYKPVDTITNAIYVYHLE